MRRRRRKVSAIHAGPRPRPAAAASSKQRGRGLGTARSAGGARAARRRRCPGSPEAQTAEPVSTPADWASPRAAALRAGDRRAGPWSAEASRRDSSILLNVVPHSAPVGPPPHPSIVPQPQTGVRSSGHPSTATGITWAATPQCLACCPRARSFPVRLEQSPRPPIKFAQDLPLRIGGLGGRGLRESEIVFSGPPKSATMFLHPAPARDHLTKAVLPAWHLGRPCREGAQTKHSSAFSCVGVPADLGPRVFHPHLGQGRLKMTLLSLFFYPSHRGSLLPGEIGDNFKLREEQPSKRNKLYNHHARVTKVSRPSSISNTSLLISEICIVLTLRLGSNRTEILLTVNFADNQNLF